jgi:gluconolactonase
MPVMFSPRAVLCAAAVSAWALGAGAQAPPPAPALPVPASSIAPDIPGVVVGGTPVQFLRAGFEATEGPIQAPDGSLLFTTGSTITRVDVDGTFSTYMQDTAGIIGLGFDHNGRLIGVRTDPPHVLVLQPERRVLADKVAGLPLLRPNDLSIDSRNGIYFSDAARQPQQIQVPEREKGLLYLRPDGTVVQVATDIVFPNGVVLSPDEKVLYAADSRSRSLIAFDVKPDGTLGNRRNFGMLEGYPLQTPTGLGRSSDGLAVDAEGRVYAATRLGVEVLDPRGRHLGTIPVQGGNGRQNIAFAGRNKKTLFIVGARAIWKVEMLAEGVKGRAK